MAHFNMYAEKHLTDPKFWDDNNGMLYIAPLQNALKTLREGNRRGLLRGDVATWDNFLNARDITSHTYQAQIAAQVFDEISSFIEEASFLSHKLEQLSND